MAFHSFKAFGSQPANLSISDSTVKFLRYFKIRPKELSTSDVFAMAYPDTDEIDIAFHEYRGDGAPNDSLGVLGDVYLDLTAPGGCVLYGNGFDRWLKWPGFDPLESGLTASSSNALGNFVFHPHFKRILFCDGTIVNWFSPESVRGIVNNLCTNRIISRIPVNAAKAGSTIISHMLSYNEASKVRGKRVLPSPDADSRTKRAKVPPVQDSSSSTVLLPVAQATPMHWNHRCERPPPLPPVFPTKVHAFKPIMNVEVFGASHFSKDRPTTSNLQHLEIQTKPEKRTENATTTAMDVSQTPLLGGGFSLASLSISLMTCSGPWN